MSALLTALRRKYKSPQAVLARLGMDAGLLRQCGDDEPEESAKLLEILRNLKPKQIRALRDALAKNDPDDEEGERADGDPRKNLGDEFEAELGEGENAEQTGSGSEGPQGNPDPRTTSSGFPKYRTADPESGAIGCRSCKAP